MDEPISANMQRNVVHSIRASIELERGKALAQAGKSEPAVNAFRAVLAAVIHSDDPSDVALRQMAADELLLLIREDLQ